MLLLLAQTFLFCNFLTFGSGEKYQGCNDYKNVLKDIRSGLRREEARSFRRQLRKVGPLRDICAGSSNLTSVVNATCSRGGPKFIIDTFGGPGGTAFTDAGVASAGLISEVDFRSGDLVDAIRVRYGTVLGNWHGGIGGVESSFKTRSKDDKILMVFARSGQFVDSLTLVTEQSAILGPVGGQGGSPQVFTHQGCYLQYFSGRAGSLIDSLTLHWVCPCQFQPMFAEDEDEFADQCNQLWQNYEDIIKARLRMDCGFKPSEYKGSPACLNVVKGLLTTCSDDKEKVSCVISESIASGSCGNGTQTGYGTIWEELCGTFWNEESNLKTKLENQCQDVALTAESCSFLDVIKCTASVLAAAANCNPLTFGCVAGILGPGSPCVSCICSILGIC